MYIVVSWVDSELDGVGACNKYVIISRIHSCFLRIVIIITIRILIFFFLIFISCTYYIDIHICIFVFSYIYYNL